MKLTKQQKRIKIDLFKQGLKKCPKCPESKPLSEFGKDKNKSNGLHSYCKLHAKKYRDENSERNKKYAENYRDKNKEKLAKDQRERRKNPENKVKRAKQDREYRNKSENKEKKRIYRKNKLKTDVNFRILSNLRIRLYYALKNNSKSKRTLELLGCTIDELKIYLQSQFTKGMNWNNYGTWHIDHRKPCAKFDLSKPIEQHKCFHFSNLQPLWAIDNLRKGIK